MPAPPRTARIPAQSPGATQPSSSAAIAFMRAWPTLSKRAYSSARSALTAARDSSSRAASRASRSIGRAMTWMRRPIRMGRSARARIAAMRSAIRSGGSPHIR